MNKDDMGCPPPILRPFLSESLLGLGLNQPGSLLHASPYHRYYTLYNVLATAGQLSRTTSLSLTVRNRVFTTSEIEMLKKKNRPSCEVRRIYAQRNNCRLVLKK